MKKSILNEKKLKFQNAKSSAKRSNVHSNFAVPQIGSIEICRKAGINPKNVDFSWNIFKNEFIINEELFADMWASNDNIN